MTVSRPSWLVDGVIYQIYPASFADANGDGMGDLVGVIDHLDYLQWLGVTTLWINPCFVSPFTDGGYDIADYLRVDPRYGSAEDVSRLCEAAHERGMRVLLDLVAGHTSDQHSWFVDSSGTAEGEHADRYIWTPSRTIKPVGYEISSGDRDGCFLPNFFATQPALNFGFGRADPAEPWRQHPEDPGPTANRAALRQIMSYWLDRGADGFRVDMAASLVKDDATGEHNRRLWWETRAWLDREYPDAVMVSEWGDPVAADAAGFHLDFFLHFKGRAFRSLFDNGQGIQVPDWEPGPCYFDAAGTGSAMEFIDIWDSVTREMGEGATVCLPTSNHDFPRLACGDRDAEQVRAAMVMVLTWPSVPAIYFGDEIGMRFIPDLPDHEGSRLGEHYNRAGSRTPMQWTAGAAEDASGQSRYLPIDQKSDRPSVAAQRDDPDSLLNLVRDLIRLRTTHRALGSDGAVEVVAGRDQPYPLVYLRSHGDTRFLVAMNPRRQPAETTVPESLTPKASRRSWLGRGTTLDGNLLRLDGFGYGIWSV